MRTEIMEQVDVIVIGAGVIGLSIAERLSDKKRSVYVIERHPSFGQETSSRNSEVIHAGIYYPKDSLKARSCVEGNRLLYEICSKNKIPCKRTGKLIVATCDEEIADLEGLLKNGQDNAVESLRIIGKNEIKKLEPNIKAKAAIGSPSTGIIDSHSLMQYFIDKMKQNNAEVVYNSSVEDVKKADAGYQVLIKDASAEKFCFNTRILINCAGLESDTIAQKVGIDIKRQAYDLKYCKGQYFRLGNNKAKLVNRLIYPVPKPKSAGLGVHATVDLAGGLRLGPDDKYIKRNQINYDVDIREKNNFLNSAKAFLPFLESDDLIPDTAGIRPKLQGETE
ncbi:MAG: NAD(P)/FAD-dependent oxidoreductase, partial [Candidatus Omnitrophica bacterium]|nr:NAD(P)/FAD-dependent oxidoreductase [Candidatus Omnitrophota bacterium]